MNDAADRLPWTTGAQIASLEAEVARLTQQHGSDRDFIEQKFRDGCGSAALDEQSVAACVCPYEATSLAAHWWTRGYAYESRILRAKAAEARLAALTAIGMPLDLDAGLEWVRRLIAKCHKHDALTAALEKDVKVLRSLGRDAQHGSPANFAEQIWDVADRLAAMRTPNQTQGCCRCGTGLLVGISIEVGPFCWACWEAIRTRVLWVEADAALRTGTP